MQEDHPTEDSILLKTSEKNYDELKQEFDDFVLQIVDILNPLKPLPGITDKNYAITLIEELVKSESALQKTLSQKEKSWALKEKELEEQKNHLENRIKKMEETIEAQKNTLEDQKNTLIELKKDVKDHGKDIVIEKEKKTFLNQLKGLFKFEELYARPKSAEPSWTSTPILH